ncbi:MAG: acetate--CoA ligase family protein [Candidatus Thermoplasmatota archaeon]|nr:acetate--CoA ligase family protein [Candidatus Thermoplasmatota archaeon]
MKLSEDDSKRLLSEFGFERPEHAVLRGGELEKIDIRDKVEGLSYPLVAKVNAPEVGHKTDVKGIQLSINSYDELIATLEEFGSRFPGDDILIEEHIPHEFEFILGSKVDETFGQVIMFGGGGVLTEVYEDVVFRKPPVDEREGKRMIEKTKIGEVLRDYRSIDLDPDTILRSITALSDLVTEVKDVVELDVNPLVCVGNRPIALDAKIALDGAG